ncbi:T9SS type A sorting domain-containing protein [Chryseobacterium sp. W4I1]|uniref:T9SS type A sorting domain-containing protein n=1 Tax=Chryseobacterium sp. W4I1 TaxID=3042293 RepID=UPI0027D83ACE|nr:T9SS type A sorting domain-containing protein [Chryseobacterium sp. W4I1]
MIITLSFCRINAQNYAPLTVTSGYNADLIAEKTGPASLSTTASVDKTPDEYVFVSEDFVSPSGISPIVGLPTSGVVDEIYTPGLFYQLAPYNGNNALKLSNVGDSGVISFSTTPRAKKLFLLVVTGANEPFSPAEKGMAYADVIVNFTDGTSQAFISNFVDDWWGGAWKLVAKAQSKVSRVSDLIKNNPELPRFFHLDLSLSPENQVKNILNISVTKSPSPPGSIEGNLCVFGVSHEVSNGCVAPPAITAGNVTTNSATVSWSAVAGASSYELYVSNSYIAPTPSDPPTDPGITGTSKDLINLSPGIPYYVWVRTSCSPGIVSEWSQVSTSFSTPCLAANVPYTEDFENYIFPFLPQCISQQKINLQGNDWSAGSGYLGFGGLNTNVASLQAGFYFNANTWLYTSGISLEAGKNYTFTFDYVNSGSPQSFKVAYGTSPVNTAMTNLIQDYPNINLSAYASASFTITPATTGVYYFGFNVYTPGTPTGPLGLMVLDNIELTTATLSTLDHQLSGNNIKFYPNPTSDYLYVKNNNKTAEMKVLDISGKLVLSFKKPEEKIDVSKLAKGTYILSVSNSDGTSSAFKFIKK